MKFLLALTLSALSFFSHAQTIVNIVLVGDKGMTENIKEAHYAVIVKQYPGYFQRLEARCGLNLS